VTATGAADTAVMFRMRATDIDDVPTANEINDQVDAAISDARLDEILSAPLSALPAADSLFDDLTENDGGILRFTANALEQAAASGTPTMLLDTTVATVNSQTSFDLAAGPAGADGINGQTAVLYDADNSDSPSVRTITDYDEVNTRIIIDSAPDFTVVAGDGVKVFVAPPGTTPPTAAQVADAVLDELTADHQSAGSLGKELKDIQAYIANKRVVKHNSGAVEVREDNGTDVRFTATPSKDTVNNETTITVT